MSITLAQKEAGRKWRERNPTYFREYQEANRERLREQNRLYREQNREKKAIADRRWRLANKERKAASSRAWALAHPERRLEAARRSKYKRRAALLSKVIETVDRDLIFVRDHGTCGICHKRVGQKEISLDHIVPLSRGGDHSYQNIQLAHLICNKSRNNRGASQTRLLP